MPNQIIDIVEVASPGPMGDVTPAAIAARDAAESAADAAVEARDQAEVFAGDAGTATDAQMVAVYGAGSSDFRAAVDSRTLDLISANVPPLPADVVRSPTVTRIVALGEGEPLPALLEGDLVVRYSIPGNVYYKDFSGDTIDQPPAGMTNLMGSGMAVKLVTGATGGKALQASAGSTGITAWAITASLTDPFLSRVEILTRWRLGSSHGVGMLFNVDAASDSSYRASYNLVSGTGRARVTVRKDGANATAPEATITALPASTWCMSRARIEGGVIKVKHWVDGGTEPDWQFSLTNSLIPTGPAAIGTGGSTSFDVDWVVVATGGKVAVKP